MFHTKANFFCSKSVIFLVCLQHTSFSLQGKTTFWSYFSCFCGLSDKLVVKLITVGHEAKSVGKPVCAHLIKTSVRCSLCQYWELRAMSSLITPNNAHLKAEQSWGSCFIKYFPKFKQMPPCQTVILKAHSSLQDRLVCDLFWFGGMHILVGKVFRTLILVYLAAYSQL